MHTLRISVARMLASLRESRPSASLAPTAVAIGIVLVALGWILEEESIGIGGAVRVLGGIVFLAGLATVVFGDSRRRAVAIGMSKGILARYKSRTAHWSWPDRVGLAAVGVGVVLIIPAVVFQIIFRNGSVVAWPAVTLFCVGVLLLIYGRFHGLGEVRTRERPSSPSRGTEPGFFDFFVEGWRNRNRPSSASRSGRLHNSGKMSTRDRSSSPSRTRERDKRLR